MAILGKIDRRDVATVTVGVDGVTVTGSAGGFTDPASSNYIEPGDILEIADVPYVVYSVTDATTLQLKRDAVPGSGLAAARRTPPKEVADYVNASGDSFVGDLLCLSLAEAQDPGSRARGLTGPGWWHYKTYVDASGNTRHKAECIASFAISGGTAGVVGDDTLLNDATTAEDTVAGQDDAIITLVAPVDANVVEPANAIFDASGSSVSSGSLIFQWQRKPAGGRFANISDGADYSGTTTGILTVLATSAADNNGDQYRVKLSSDTGAPEVVSAAVNLTVA